MAAKQVVAVMLALFSPLEVGGDVNAASINVALIGSFLDPAQFVQYLNTSWKFVPDTPIPSRDVLESVRAVVETSIDITNLTTNAELYQYTFTGYDEDDLKKIPAHFTVANVHQSGVPISEYVLAGVLDFTVGIHAMDAAFRNCTWKDSPPGNDCQPAPQHRQLANLTIGIIGYGHIGENIATRAAAFGTRVVATTLNPPSTAPPPLAWIGDDSQNPRLMEESDFVVIACPLTSNTEGLVNDTLISMMKPDGVLINIARGPVVSESALFKALSSGSIGGAVLDVWWNSHSWSQKGAYGPASWPSQYRFDELPSVLMTPHSSSHTPESEQQSYLQASENLNALALGLPLQNVVRTPQ